MGNPDIISVFEKRKINFPQINKFQFKSLQSRTKDEKISFRFMV